jgi:hypothetical protein
MQGGAGHPGQPGGGQEKDNGKNGGPRIRGTRVADPKKELLIILLGLLFLILGFTKIYQHFHFSNKPVV